MNDIEFTLTWTLCPPTEKDLAEIKAKSKAIIDNARYMCAYIKGAPVNAFEAENIVSITVDCDDDTDNFYLLLDPTVKGKGFPIQRKGRKTVGFCPCYEVVDEATARARDAGMHQGWPHFTEDSPYALGGENSDYYKLGDSGYYYRPL